MAAAMTFIVAGFAVCLCAQQNRIDVVTPLAPELASYGERAIGVRTVQATDRNRPDVLSLIAGRANARYDRTLVVEVWYPAQMAAGSAAGGDYHTITRDPAVATTLHGRAVRDAAPSNNGAPFPLVIVSHGYPGNRYLMSHLCENLASKGFIVASIDHKESTYDDQRAFASTLYNRPLDQLFVLNEMARLGRTGSGNALAGLVDADHAGIVGYSMGGYGVVNAIGGREYDLRRIQRCGRDARTRAAECDVVGARCGECGVSRERRPADQSRDCDRPVGHAGWILGCEWPRGDQNACAVRRRQSR